MRRANFFRIRTIAGIWTLFLLTGMTAVFGMTAAAATEDFFDNIRFQWAFGAIASNAQNPRLQPITEDGVLKTGDKFKMLVELKKKCFVYVIYQNAQGEVTMLFPYSLKQFDFDYEVSKKYYVPRGDTWFQLDDNTGRETFYLLASHQRLGEVEYLLNLYESSDQARKKQIAGQMVAEIHNIEKQQRQFAAETQNPMLASSTRGVERALGQDPSDVAEISNEVSAEDFYTRTIVIEHR